MKMYAITGACGSGKSTMRDALAGLLDETRYACIDTDELGLNWWNYAGTEREPEYKSDCLKEAVRRAAGRDLVFSSCLNPQDYIAGMKIPEEIDATFFIVLNPSDDTIWERLRARPAERLFTSDDIIRPHVEYNAWFRRNRGKFQLHIDNSDMPEAETARMIEEFIKRVEVR